MSATFSEKRSAGPDVWRLLGSRFLEVLKAWRRARGTYRALSELDDDMLHDIGLHRSEIASVALGVRSRVST
jgi:uncharacterized protein YjiS (DUF1127 family)